MFFCQASICFHGNLKDSEVSSRKSWVWIYFTFGAKWRQTSQGLDHWTMVVVREEQLMIFILESEKIFKIFRLNDQRTSF